MITKRHMLFGICSKEVNVQAALQAQDTKVPTWDSLSLPLQLSNYPSFESRAIHPMTHTKLRQTTSQPGTTHFIDFITAMYHSVTQSDAQEVPGRQGRQ